VVADGDIVSEMGVTLLAHDPRVRSDRLSTCARDATRLGRDDARGAIVSYSLAELSKRSGVTLYRIRHYVNGGIVPPARRAGSASVFGEDHVERLAVIERLRARRMGVPEIRQRVRTLSAQQLRVLAGLEAEPVEAPPPPPPPVVVTKPAKGARELRDAVDALLCVAAEALDVSPKALRPAFDAVFARMSESELSAAEVVAVLRGERSTP
jgi:DNA-binding transcriptional MerR regulator